MGTAAIRRRVTAEERSALAHLSHAAHPTRLTERAVIVLAVLDGTPPAVVARRTGLPRTTIYSWVRRFAVAGVAGLDTPPRRGQCATLAARE